MFFKIVFEKTIFSIYFPIKEHDFPSFFWAFSSFFPNRSVGSKSPSHPVDLDPTCHILEAMDFPIEIVVIFVQRLPRKGIRELIWSNPQMAQSK